MSTNQEADTKFPDITRLTPADFESLLDTEFSVDMNYFGIAPDGSPIKRNDVYPNATGAKLRLIEVARKTRLSSDLREEPFVLLFCGSHAQPLYADTHVLQHEALGRIVLFICSVNAAPGILPQQHPDGRFYEAVIG